jgi:iron complex outermembrane receptor protein
MHHYSQVKMMLCAATALSLFPAIMMAAPQQRPTSMMSLKDLVNMKVTSVSKREEKASEAAAALFVITAEDIRRSGATSIPEVLRMAPGVQVARSTSTGWAVSARGFNDQFSNKLLVLIDGRCVYSPTFSGVWWDAQSQMLDTIERIEIIRGPGATLWGAEAVNGVINIISKDAAATQGTRVEGLYGHREAGGSMRYGGELGDVGHYRAYAELDEIRNNVTPNGIDDDGIAGNGGFRVDWQSSDANKFSVSGDMYRLEESYQREYPILVSPFTESVMEDENVTGGNITAKWDKTLSQKANSSLKFDYAQENRNRSFFIKNTVQSVDVNYKYNWNPNEHNNLVMGAGYRLNQDVAKGSYYVDFVPDDATDNEFNVFVQNKIPLVPKKLYLTAGAKMEYNEYTQFEFQPSGRLTWLPNDNHTFWAAVSHARRTPSRGTYGFRFKSGVNTGLPAFLQLTGQNGVESERMTAYELGYRAKPTDNIAYDVALFYNQYKDLVTFAPNAPFVDGLGNIVVPLLFDNRDKGEAYGGELSVNWRVHDNWKLAAAYSFLKNDLRGNGVSISPEGTSPEHQVNLRSYIDLPNNFEFDSFVYYNDVLSGEDIDSYIRLDARLGWNLTENLELSLIGQNLTDPYHEEFSPFAYSQKTEVGRTVFGRAALQF